jgi:hypothetical protein
MVIVEKLVEWRLARETEVLGENLPHFVHHKSHMTIPGFEPGPPRWEASDKPLELWRGKISLETEATVVGLRGVRTQRQDSWGAAGPLPPNRNKEPSPVMFLNGQVFFRISKWLPQNLL